MGAEKMDMSIVLVDNILVVAWDKIHHMWWRNGSEIYRGTIVMSDFVLHLIIVHGSFKSWYVTHQQRRQTFVM